MASNVGCYDETIKNGKTGYLIDPGAPPKDWVNTLTKIIKNPKHRLEMGQNLHNLTEEYFDLNKVVRSRLELYRDAFDLRGAKDLHEKMCALLGEGSPAFYDLPVLPKK